LPERGAKPAKGKPGNFEQVPEYRLEMLVSRSRLSEVLEAIRTVHSYEVPAIDILPSKRQPAGVGVGRVGELAEPMPLAKFVDVVKRACGVRDVLLAGGAGKGQRKVDTVAFCRGCRSNCPPAMPTRLSICDW
jgi:putative NIF3 family GTP cyclohydrolase 1 type 2